MGRENESSEARERRIIADRERKRYLRSVESTELKEKRLASDKERKRLMRGIETPEAKRLRRQAESDRRVRRLQQEEQATDGESGRGTGRAMVVDQGHSHDSMNEGVVVNVSHTCSKVAILLTDGVKQHGETAMTVEVPDQPPRCYKEHIASGKPFFSSGVGGYNYFPRCLPHAVAEMPFGCSSAMPFMQPLSTPSQQQPLQMQMQSMVIPPLQSLPAYLYPPTFEALPTLQPHMPSAYSKAYLQIYNNVPGYDFHPNMMFRESPHS